MISLVSYQETILFAIRVLIATTMFYYGWPKLKDLQSNAEDFENKGFKPGIFWGTGIAVLETFGATALLLGVFPQIMALLFAGHMTTGIIWKITSTDKDFSNWSYGLLILALSLVILAFGPGLYTIT